MGIQVMDRSHRNHTCEQNNWGAEPEAPLQQAAANLRLFK